LSIQKERDKLQKGGKIGPSLAELPKNGFGTTGIY